MANILISGGLAYDRIMNFPGKFSDHILPEKIHILNVSFTVEDLKESFGGTAGNIAYTLALFGMKPILLSQAGKDFAPYKTWLRKHVIQTKFVKIFRRETTATAYIITDQADNQIAGFHAGAMKISGPAVPPRVLKNTSLAIISPGNPKDMFRYAVVYKRRNVPYIFDPGQQIISFSANLLRDAISGAKAIMANDYEMGIISKKTGWDRKKLLDHVTIAVTTLGEKGSIIETEKETLKIPPVKPKNMNDPTGAGDAFRAGFIYGLVNGYELATAGRLGSLAAVYAVETFGTQTHVFTKTSFNKRFKENFGGTHVVR